MKIKIILNFLFLIFLINFKIELNTINFILISAPGSGKGTFSEYLKNKYNYIGSV